MWVTKTNLIVYCSHFLYSWGARMWMFAISMFLVRVAEDSMQLSATYGLATGLAVFFFGAIVGDWVDRTPRLKAAQMSLAMQYLLTLGCTAVVAVYLLFQQPIQSSTSWLAPVMRAGIVCLGVLADLASQTRVIVVERDWVVEICSSDPDHLASMTAMLRRLDLITMVLSPLAMGQVMQHLGLVRGAFFMGGWILASLFVQLLLTWKVYRIVPALKSIKRQRRNAETCDRALIGPEQDREEQTTEMKSGLLGNIDNGNHSENSRALAANPDHAHLTLQTHDFRIANDEKATGRLDTHVCSATTGDSNYLQTERTYTHQVHGHTEQGHDKQVQEAHALPVDKETCCARASRLGVLHQLVTLYRGGKTYMSYSVALPGLSLACLYLTVLSFDNITVAYIVTQGLSESTVGITMSSSAVFGVLSTFGYTFIRRRTGVVRTGFIGLFCEVSVLTLCVASIWMPGSPFDPLYQHGDRQRPAPCRRGQDVMDWSMLQNATTTPNPTNASVMFENGAGILSNVSDLITNSSSSSSSNSSSNSWTNGTCVDVTPKRGPDSYVSVIFFLAGIFLARFGVWMADLAITQLFLEKVAATERGIVNGVQSSLNQLMNLLKFALVVAMPDMQTFGFHVLITFGAIATANVLYVVFARRERVPLLCCQGCSPSPSPSSPPLSPPSPSPSTPPLLRPTLRRQEKGSLSLGARDAGGGDGGGKEGW